MRRRRVLAWCATGLFLLPLALWGLSMYRSVAYRSGYTLVELRMGIVGYYSNPGYKNFVWLDQGRHQGFLIDRPAAVPPTPYKLYDSNRYWNALYVKLWHAAVAGGLLAAWAWWRAARRDLPGRCFACGYDLAGLPPDDSARVSCPECGAVDDVRRAPATI